MKRLLFIFIGIIGVISATGCNSKQGTEINKIDINKAIAYVAADFAFIIPNDISINPNVKPGPPSPAPKPSPNSNTCKCNGSGAIRMPDGNNATCPCGNNCKCEGTGSKPEVSNVPEEVKENTENTGYIAYIKQNNCYWCNVVTNTTFKSLKLSGWKIGKSKDNQIIIFDVEQFDKRYNLDEVPTWISYINDKEIRRHKGYLNFNGVIKFWRGEEITKEDTKVIDFIPKSSKKTSSNSSSIISSFIPLKMGVEYFVDNFNTSPEHLMYDNHPYHKPYTREELLPYWNDPVALNRIHGYAHTGVAYNFNDNYSSPAVSVTSMLDAFKVKKHSKAKDR